MKIWKIYEPNQLNFPENMNIDRRFRLEKKRNVHFIYMKISWENNRRTRESNDRTFAESIK